MVPGVDRCDVYAGLEADMSWEVELKCWPFEELIALLPGSDVLLDRGEKAAELLWFAG